MDIQRFLEDNIELVDDNDFEQLYERCAPESRGELTDVLYGCDINPLFSMTEIPGWFAYRSTLTSITIPDCVTSMGYHAFDDCSNLTSITIPNSVTHISWRAFSDCDSLTSVMIGSGVTSIDQSAFYGCTGLTSVTIPNSVTIIGPSAFKGCTGLTSVTIPDSIRSIGEHAFYDCSSLTSTNYLGTKVQWKAIAKHQRWKRDSAIKQINCTDGIIKLR